MLSFLRHPSVVNRSATQGAMCTIWIDGVGCFWLSQRDRVTIGGPGAPTANLNDSRVTADLSILSDLKLRHATIVRNSEGYLLEAHGAVRISGRDVLERAALCDGAMVELGRSVRLKFRQPSALSLTARLDFVSDHRPTQSVDGVVLLADTCVLGSGDENHIVCHDWLGQVLLVRQGAELWCRSRQALTVNGYPLGNGRRMQSGDIVSGENSRFRIEIPH